MDEVDEVYKLVEVFKGMRQKDRAGDGDGVMAQHTINLPCIKDTWIDEANPNTSHGSDTTLKGGGKPAWHSF